MLKFKVLLSNQWFLSLICGIGVEKLNSKSEKSVSKFSSSIPVYLILFTLVYILLSSAVSAYNDSFDFTVRLTAVSITIAISQAIAMFLNMGANVPKILALYQTLKEIVDGECELLYFDLFG